MKKKKKKKRSEKVLKRFLKKTYRISAKPLPVKSGRRQLRKSNPIRNSPGDFLTTKNWKNWFLLFQNMVFYSRSLFAPSATGIRSFPANAAGALPEEPDFQKYR